MERLFSWEFPIPSDATGRPRAIPPEVIACFDAVGEEDPVL